MKIAHFGTFDVDNYGDLLFPHIARFRHPKATWVHVSPTDNITNFTDALPTISYRKAIKQDFDLVVVGGGNIIHSKPTSLNQYKSLSDYAYPALWIGATHLSISKKIPIKYNAPGIVQTKRTTIEKLFYKNAFEASSYLSFRDEESLKIASQFTTKKINVVPDTAFEVANMWPINNNQNNNYIAINLNQRYHSPINITAKYIDKLSKYTGLPVKICIIGDCHGDLTFSNNVIKELTCRNKIVRTSSLLDIAHLIGNAALFLGSSMHGFITALSYKTPALLVLNEKPMHKFIGLTKVVGINDDVICKSWADAFNKIDNPSLIGIQNINNIQKKLNTHWENTISTQMGQNSVNENLFRNWESFIKLNNTPYKIKQIMKKWLY